MALNPYFRTQVGIPSEQNLYESMIIESIQIKGLDCVYLPRTLNKFDQIYGEDTLSSFDSHGIVEMWLENYTGFGGENAMVAKFGMEIRDSASFIVSRKRYIDEIVPVVPSSRPEIIKTRPNEGDFLFLPNSKSLFEIKYVEDEHPGFLQLNKKYVWTLRCELAQLNNETFNTGYEYIDSYYGNNINRLNNSIDGEVGDNLIGEDGGVVLGEEFKTDQPYTNFRNYGDDSALKQQFLDIMDFSEDNPFGDL